jgi:hypothetical protein
MSVRRLDFYVVENTKFLQHRTYMYKNLYIYKYINIYYLRVHISIHINTYIMSVRRLDFYVVVNTMFQLRHVYGVYMYKNIYIYKYISIFEENFQT